MSASRQVVRLIVLAAVWAFAVPAQAQTPPPAFAATSAESVLADQLALMATAALSESQEPRGDQLQRAQILLDLAVTVNPNDAELWRLSLELARRMEDQPRQLRALREYLRLWPQDDRAQLQLVELQVQQAQTLPERISMLQNLLRGERAQQLSPALRSRAASMIARMADESGDTALYRQSLDQALALDATNADAAAMLYQSVAAARSDARALGLAALRWLNASPLDPSVRQILSEILAGQRAFPQAAQQLKAMSRLVEGPLQPPLYSLWAQSLSLSGDVGGALQLLDEAQSLLATSYSQTQPTAAQRELPLELEQLRLLLAHYSGRPALAETSFSRIQRALQPAIDAGDTQSGLDLAWLAVLTDREMHTAENLAASASTRAATQSTSTDPAAPLQRLRGWLALRAGQRDTARQLLQPLSTNDPFAALGLILAQGDSGGQALSTTQRQALLKLGETYPLSFAGLIAAMLASDNPSVPFLPPTDMGSQLVRQLRQLPAMLQDPNPADNPWVVLELIVTPDIYAYLEPINAQLTIRNRTPFPLSMAPQGTIPTTVVFQEVARQAGARVAVMQGPVVQLDRRLRLDSGEALKVTTRLDRDQFGALMAATPTQTLSFDVQAVLDPRATAGGIVPGLLGAVDATRLVERRGMAVSEANVQGWISALEDPDRVERLRALARLITVAAALDPKDEKSSSLIQQIARAVNERFAQLSSVSQAMAVRFLPPTPNARQVFPTIHEEASRSPDPLVRIVYLATQVFDPKDPTLVAAMADANAMIKTFAEAVPPALEAMAAARAAAAAQKAQQQGQAQPSEESSPLPSDMTSPFSPGF